MNKPTVATVKSFIRKNRENLLVRVNSDFDGMQDMVTQNKNVAWIPAQPALHNGKENQNIAGVWFVGKSRNCINNINTPQITGYEVTNCCGRWAVGVRKES